MPRAVRCIVYGVRAHFPLALLVRAGEAPLPAPPLTERHPLRAGVGRRHDPQPRARLQPRLRGVGRRAFLLHPAGARGARGRRKSCGIQRAIVAGVEHGATDRTFLPLREVGEETGRWIRPLLDRDFSVAVYAGRIDFDLAVSAGAPPAEADVASRQEEEEKYSAANVSVSDGSAGTTFSSHLPHKASLWPRPYHFKRIPHPWSP